MTKNKRFKNVEENLEWGTIQYFTYYDEKITDKELEKLVNHLLNQNDELNDENEWLKKELERCRDWINSDKDDYELTLAFIKNKGYSLKDVLEYEKEMGWE